MKYRELSDVNMDEMTANIFLLLLNSEKSPLRYKNISLKLIDEQLDKVNPSCKFSKKENVWTIDNEALSQIIRNIKNHLKQQK